MSPLQQLFLNAECGDAEGDFFVDNSSDQFFVFDSLSSTTQALVSDSGKFSSRSSVWIMDTGATSHMCSDVSIMRNITTLVSPIRITLADGSYICCSKRGSVYLNLALPSGVRQVTLTDVLFVPSKNSSINLFSVSHALKCGNFFLHGDTSSLNIVDDTGLVRVSGSTVGHLWILNTTSTSHEQPVSATGLLGDAVCTNVLELWHRRLGHLNYDAVKSIVRYNMASGITLPASVMSRNVRPFCDSCALSKSIKKSRSNESSVVHLLPGTAVAMDLSGPYRVSTVGKCKYFVVAIDMASRQCHTQLLKSKGQTLDFFKAYAVRRRNLHSRNLLTLMSDNGGEFLSDDFKAYLLEQGIEHVKANAYGHENGMPERFIRTIRTLFLAMIFHSGMHLSLWGEALGCAVTLYNLTPHAALPNVTPYQADTGKRPDFKHLRVFGTICFAHIPTELRHKLQPSSPSM